MANDTMKKVQELLEMAGLDKDVIKSVTEKLEDDEVAVDADTQNCEDGNCDSKKKKSKKDDEDEEETSDEDEEETSESAVSTARIKFQKEDDAHQMKAPVDSPLAKGIPVHEDEEITEALYVLRDAIAEARDQYIIMENDLEILKEENIPYKLHGIHKNHLPISKLESAPIIK